MLFCRRVSSRLLALAALVLLALVVLLVIETRRAPEAQTQTPTQTRTGTPTVPPPPTPAAPVGAKREPPPQKPPEAAPPPPRETLVKGELPFPPPLFGDGRDRDRFKRWWITEMVRRADVYRRLEPGRQYPTDQETEQMIGRLYDLAEPPPENADQATAAQYIDRQQQYFQLANKDFVKAFGVPATEIMRRGGDPKFGAAPDPPVLPPGWKGP
jgi:hypothetical protein